MAVPNVNAEQFFAQMAKMANNGANVGAKWAKKVSDMRPKEYNGNENPADLEDWIDEMDKVLETIECPEDRKVRCAVFYLKTEANIWWKNSNEALLDEPNINWEALQAALRARFYLAYVKTGKYREFLNLRQGGDFVAEYYRKFTELTRFAGNIVPDEDAKVAKFITGLHDRLQETMLSRTYLTLSEVYDRAAGIWRVRESRDDYREKRKVKGFGDNNNAHGGNQNTEVKKFKSHNGGNGQGQFQSNNQKRKLEPLIG